ncbi:ABC transporter permease [Eubacteriales bacterium OttesenSCG-928-M02]|nr:ABC transporter permease [Eubacteriales bacterium OttesenSCG-928-M02]
MLNYIRAEFYKTTHRKGFYVLTATFMGICLLVHGIYAMSMPREAWSDYISFILSAGVMLLILPIFLIATISSMTTGEEQRHDTLKNAVMSGMNRTSLFFGKYIVSLIISLVSGVMILLAYAGVPMLLFGGAGIEMAYVQELGIRLLGALPIYMGSLALATLLGLTMKSNTGSIFGYLAIFFFSNPILYYLLGKIIPFFRTVKDYTLYTQLEIMANGMIYPMEMHYVTEAILVGLVTTVLFLGVGALLFRRQEIK